MTSNNPIRPNCVTPRNDADSNVLKPNFVVNSMINNPTNAKHNAEVMPAKMLIVYLTLHSIMLSSTKLVYPMSS